MNGLLDEGARQLTADTIFASAINLPGGTTRIDTSRFRPLSEEPAGSICYIDGGSATIFASSNKICNSIRTAGTTYQDTKRQTLTRTTSLVIGTVNPTGITLQSIGRQIILPPTLPA